MSQRAFFELEIKETVCYKVAHSKDIICRDGVSRESEIVGKLRQGTIVKSDRRIGRRLHITQPIIGWVSVENRKGYKLLEQTKKETYIEVKFKKW